MYSFVLIILFSINCFAQNLSQSFPAGSGSNFEIKFQNQNAPINASIYIAGTRTESVFVEYMMETKELIPVQLWQQFEIQISENGSKIKSGYVLGKDFKSPEIIPPEFLKEESGIPLSDFLLKKENEFKKFKIADEIVEIAAGSTKATHYRMTKNDQILDFWISNEAKPLGLVMLTSKNSKVPDQNYSLQLVSLIENIKAKIEPEKSVPLTEKGKSIVQRSTTPK